MSTDMKVSLAVLFFGVLVPCFAQADAGWVRSEQKDALRGTSFLQFRLAGKFLAPPKTGDSEAPAMIAHCLPGKHERIYNGKVIDFYVHVGAVLNSEKAFVSVRLNDGKVQQELWSTSTDRSAAFFSSLMLNNFLYGHILPHKEGSGPPVRKVVIGVEEFLAGVIVMQFDMPDPSEIQEACGVVAHKR